MAALRQKPGPTGRPFRRPGSSGRTAGSSGCGLSRRRFSARAAAIAATPDRTAPTWPKQRVHCGYQLYQQWVQGETINPEFLLQG
jgi:hypothetical protein